MGQWTVSPGAIPDSTTRLYQFVNRSGLAGAYINPDAMLMVRAISVVLKKKARMQ